eukprot:gene5904-11241_t
MSNSLQEQRRLIEEKKRQVLERTSVKKDSEKLMSGTSVQAAGPSPVLLVNDGNFLARFQAMQKESTVKKGSNKKDESNSGKLTINLGGARKKEVKPIASNLPRPTAFEVPENETEETEEDVLKAAEDLAIQVAKEGDEAEALARMKYQKDQRYRFLFDVSHPAYQKYRNLVKEKIEKNKASEQERLGKRKRKNRWDDKSTDATSFSSVDPQQPVGVQSVPAQGSSSSQATPGPSDIMEEFERAKALIKQKAALARSGVSLTVDAERQKQIEMQQEIEAMYRRIIAEQAIKARHNAQKNEDKPRYEYDSDEEIDGGTWEHKKRKKEMEKTLGDSSVATERAQGKHFMGDFLPPEELAKFQEKVKAIKEGRKADLSDYAEFKIKEDNIGYKMLQQAGWQEGAGLGSSGKGIKEPINKGATSFDNAGVGVEKPAEVAKDDDEFDIYRKRMMLAYKFRPNPLNNPRRPYY